MNEPRQPRKLNTGSATGRAAGASGGAGRKINRSAAAGAGQSAPRQAAQSSYRAPSPSGSQPPRRKKKKHRSTLSILLTTLLSLVLVVGIGLFGLYKWVVHSISPEGGAPTINELINTPTEFEGDVVNLLVCGIDYEEGRAYSNDPDSNDGMTDMIMYVNFDIKGRKINMLQIPRDTYAGENYKTGGTGKINSVALKNDGVASLANLISEQYKLPIDHYVTIDMQSLKEVVDMFGGIEVYVPQDMEYKGSVLKQGMQIMSGSAAEFFVRNRNYAQADIARLDMQRYFYQGLFKRIRTANVWDLAKLSPVALKYTTTDIPLEKLVSIGVSFLKVDSADIMLCKVPTYSAAERYNGQSIQVCDTAKTTDLLNQYFRIYGGEQHELPIPTLATAGGSTDPNVQYMGQIDTETETDGGDPLA